MHPYRTLNVPLDADSETIRQAYLAAIRRHPPEREPERFRLVNRAYDAIKTEDLRLKREIGIAETESDSFDPFNSPLEAVAVYWQADLDPQLPGEDDFYSFLKA